MTGMNYDIYTRTDGKPICISCVYVDKYHGCKIGANDTTVKFPSSCTKYVWVKNTTAHGRKEE